MDIERNRDCDPAVEWRGILVRVDRSTVGDADSDRDWHCFYNSHAGGDRRAHSAGSGGEVMGKLDDQIKRQREQFLRNRAMVHLEMAISSLLDGYTQKEVIDLLRRQAQMLEDHG